MAKGQETAPRRKLQPKKPTYRKPTKGIEKKHKTFHFKHAKEETLTKNQQAWARSLTGSLSGWGSRQKFYKTHLEAYIQVEAEAKAAEAAYDAQRLSRCEAEAERRATEQNEAEKKKAEAWERKAWAMHNAGRGERKLGHEYYGWDPEEQEYPRDLETERLMALLKARRKAKRRAAARAQGLNEDDVYDSDRSDSDDSDSDSSGAIGIVDPGPASSRSLSRSPSRSPLRPAPVIEQGSTVDWRDKARAGVIKKKLFATKEWGAITWNQKSNIQERLLVLEDDGYNIQELMDGRATSEQVTAIILSRAATKQQPGPPVNQSGIQTEHPELLQGPSGNLPLSVVDPALTEQFLESVDQASPLRSPFGAALPTLSSHHPVESPHQQLDSPEIEDDTQPFSFDEPYYPRPSRSLKRKYDADPNRDFEADIALSDPAHKKRKIEVLPEDGLAAQALHDEKRGVLREVFRSARSVVRKALPPSRIIFSTEVSSVKSRASSPNYVHSGPFRRGPIKSFPSISKRALDNIVVELRFLTNSTDGNSTIQIYDADCDADMTYTAVKPENFYRQYVRTIKPQASHITIDTGEEGQVILQGDAIILAELLKALRKRELLHYCKWEWDGLRLHRSSDLPWYLSPQTHDTFLDIESRLRQPSQTRPIELVVGVVDNVRTHNVK